MDRIEISTMAKNLFAKYKYVFLILGIGILLMLLPSESIPATQPENMPAQEESTRAQELE